MSYRCRACGKASEDGKPMLRHQIKRVDGQIASEVPVCHDCSVELKTVAFEVLLRRHSREPAPIVLVAPTAPAVKAVPVKSLAERINQTRSVK